MPRRQSHRVSQPHRRLARGLCFEALEARNLLAADFGDAPLPYPVASHEAIGPTLGALRDTEAASQPTTNADGDGADDDGVTFGSLRVGQLGATVTVNVQNAPAGAKLDAWIDFNGDGNWGGAGEHVFDSVAVAEGDNALTLDVPASAASGVTFARFRLTTDGDLAIGGAALDGEVEDFSVTIAAPLAATGFFGSSQVLQATSAIFGLAAGDIDGDGDVDLVTSGDNRLSWRENLGNGTFEVHEISHTLTNVADVSIVNMDGDGDLDLLVAAGTTVAWFENDGSESFAQRHVATRSDTATLSVSAADIDGDGDQDVLVAWYFGGGATVYENDGEQSYIAHALPTPAPTNSAWSVQAADVDADGALDIVLTADSRNASSADTLAWYRNMGSFTFERRGVDSFSTQGVTANVLTFAIAADLDGDGDLDLAAAGRSTSSLSSVPTVLWYEQTAGHVFVEHTLATSRNGETIGASDFDGDGDVDLLVTGQSDSIDYYENSGHGGFTRRTLGAIDDGYGAVAADINGDGVLDAVVAGRNASSLAWFAGQALIDADYGDAPLPYPTTRSNQGAGHAGGGPRLGAARDSEPDGEPSAAADADAGDDGVTFSGLAVGAAGGAMAVDVQNAPAGARVSLWIDFGGDGAWSDSIDSVLSNVPVAEGVHEFMFSVPATAAGNTFARVRISTSGDPGPVGLALDGEVEDYGVTIAPPASSTGEYIASPTGSSGNALQLVDMDGDGDLDQLRGYSPNEVTFHGWMWSENLDGASAWLNHYVGPGGSVPAAIEAIDFDRDGDKDVVAVMGSSLYWYDNNGEESFYRRLIGNGASARAMEVADAEGDGDWDVLLQGTAIGWQLNNGSMGFESRSVGSYAISTSRGDIVAADADGDGDLDIVASHGPDLLWLELATGGLTYVVHTLEIGAGMRDASVVDLDGDGDADIVAHASNTLSWFENQGGGSFTKRTIGAASAATSVGSWDFMAVFDADSDGDLDVATLAAGGIRLFKNNGSQAFSALELTATPTTTPVGVTVGDLNGDGDLEIVASGGSGYELLPFGDYDRNGRVDQADRDLWQQTNGQTVATPGAGADGDRSGMVDAGDLAVWEAHEGERIIQRVRAANAFKNNTLDEAIDGYDFLAWQRTLGTVTEVGGFNDWDLSGKVDAGDVETWKRHAIAGLVPNSQWINTGTIETAVEPASTAEIAAAVVAATQPVERPHVAAPDVPALPRNVILARGESAVTGRQAYRPPRRLVEAALLLPAAREASPLGSAACTATIPLTGKQSEFDAIELLDAAFDKWRDWDAARGGLSWRRGVRG